MNRITLSILALLMLLFTSCQFSENIYINEDGSGKMEFSMDASQLMKMGGDKMKEEAKERIDSTIVFKEFFEEKKDSIAKLSKAEQEKLKTLENFKMHMVMDAETSQMQFDLISDFKNASELQDMFKAMNSASNLQGKGGTDSKDSSNPFSSIGEDGATTVSYSYNNGVFKRTAKIIDAEKHQIAIDSMESMAMMFESSKYKLNYHFPRPIKSVSNENAMFSDDRKSFTLEVGFMETLKTPEVLDIEVVLED